MNRLYKKLSIHLGYKVNAEYDNLFDLDYNHSSIYKDCTDKKILVNKNKQIKFIKTIVKELGCKRLRKLGFKD